MRSLRQRLSFRVALALVMSGLISGCARKSLFPKKERRNQFEAYNTMRFGPQIIEQPDLFGLPETALRERLGKKNY